MPQKTLNRQIYYTNMLYSVHIVSVLQTYPIIDGHNDLPFMLKNVHNNDVSLFPFTDDLTNIEPYKE